MDAGQRTALLRLSLFDCITPDMIDRLVPPGTLPEGGREELFRRTPLVRQDAMRRRYYPHELLLRFLRERLAETEGPLRREIYRPGRDSGTGTTA